MHTEFSYDDYLFLEIQKHLLELEELTTDVTYSKVVYKMLMKDYSMEDSLTSTKGQFIDTVVTPNLEDFDYIENKNKFVLQQIIDTLKYIKANIKESVNDKPDVFFCNVFKKLAVEDSNKPSSFNNKHLKVVITDKEFNSTRSSNFTRGSVQDSVKKSTTISKM